MKKNYLNFLGGSIQSGTEEFSREHFLIQKDRRFRRSPVHDTDLLDTKTPTIYTTPTLISVTFILNTKRSRPMGVRTMLHRTSLFEDSS